MGSARVFQARDELEVHCAGALGSASRLNFSPSAGGARRGDYQYTGENLKGAFGSVADVYAGCAGPPPVTRASRL